MVVAKLGQCTCDAEVFVHQSGSESKSEFGSYGDSECQSKAAVCRVWRGRRKQQRRRQTPARLLALGVSTREDHQIHNQPNCKATRLFSLFIVYMTMYTADESQSLNPLWLAGRYQAP